MDRYKLLLTLGTIFGCLLSLLVALPATALSSCQPSTSALGSCSGAQTNSNSVDVWARSVSPGRTVIQAGSSSQVGASRTGSRAFAPIVAPWRYVFCMGLLKIDNVCKPAAPVLPSVDAPIEVVYDPIDLSDLANFTPENVSLSSQPSGWGVIGLPVNFVASASTHVVSGRLFGQATEVRFTPQAFEWNFGDGVTATSTSGGVRWEQLGLTDFSPTPTSHIYTQPGTFTVSVTVRYGVEYRIGTGGWNSVAGTVSREASTSLVVVLSADTVLTTGDCITARDAKSCP